LCRNWGIRALHGGENELDTGAGAGVGIQRDLLVGVEEARVQAAIDVIHEHSHSRKQMIPATTEVGMSYMPTMPVEVNVGGATVFVVDVERFERL